MSCERYQNRCGECPSLGEWPLDSRFDFTGFMQTVRGRLHRSGRVACLTPSNWMADTALSSSQVQLRPQVLPNGVNTDLYSPTAEKAAVRRRLGLPESRLILLASAGYLGDERKGVKYAVQAARRLADLNPLLLLVGDTSADDEVGLEGIDWTATGYLREPERIADAYRAADLFLFCSLADNQPLAVLESMACGTPVIAFDTGGLPEIVLDGLTGRIVPQRNEDELVAAVRDAVVNDRIARWGTQARDHIEGRHSLTHFVDNHLAAYQQIVNRWSEAVTHA